MSKNGSMHVHDQVCFHGAEWLLGAVDLLKMGSDVILDLFHKL